MRLPGHAHTRHNWKISLGAQHRSNVQYAMKSFTPFSSSSAKLSPLREGTSWHVARMTIARDAAPDTGGS